MSDNLLSTFVCAAAGVIPPSPSSETEPAEAPPCLVKAPLLLSDIWSLYNFSIPTVGPSILSFNLTLIVLLESSATNLTPPGGSLLQVPTPRLCAVID